MGLDFRGPAFHPDPVSREEHLSALGLSLPVAPPAAAAYATWVRTGSLIFTSGQLPWRDGVLLHPGRLGLEVTEAQGYEAARCAALNALAQLRAAVGDLDRVRRILKVEGYLQAAPGFLGHPRVLNGASDLFNALFPGTGSHVRLAVGVGQMPFDAPVQLLVTAEATG